MEEYDYTNLFSLAYILFFHRRITINRMEFFKPISITVKKMGDYLHGYNYFNVAVTTL